MRNLIRDLGAFALFVLGFWAFVAVSMRHANEIMEKQFMVVYFLMRLTDVILMSAFLFLLLGNLWLMQRAARWLIKAVSTGNSLEIKRHTLLIAVTLLFGTYLAPLTLILIAYVLGGTFGIVTGETQLLLIRLGPTEQNAMTFQFLGWGPKDLCPYSDSCLPATKGGVVLTGFQGFAIVTAIAIIEWLRRFVRKINGWGNPSVRIRGRA